MLFFFFVWEARILCSHCPYWAEEGRILHCHANYGVIKIWRYHPEPMSKFEQVQFIVGVLIFLPLSDRVHRGGRAGSTGRDHVGLRG